MSSCDRCDKVRAKACHCALCHETFSTLKLFDRHQSVNYERTPMIECKDPASLGFVLDAWSTWRTPENLLATTNRVSAMNTSRFEKRVNG